MASTLDYLMSFYHNSSSEATDLEQDQKLYKMDGTKNRKNLDVKYLHPFSTSPPHNGHRHSAGAEGKTS